jgi:hypothetical protein
MLHESPNRFHRRVFFIREENTARIEEMDREIATLSGEYPRFISEEPYAMRLEPLQNLPHNVFAGVRRSLMLPSADRHRCAH